MLSRGRGVHAMAQSPLRRPKRAHVGQTVLPSLRGLLPWPSQTLRCAWPEERVGGWWAWLLGDAQVAAGMGIKVSCKPLQE